MVTKDEHLDFISTKIDQLRIAIFRAEIRSVLKLPNNIISTLKTDNNGNIWFFTSCNGSYAKDIDRKFYACLDYYQKGRDYRLRVNGTASIVEDFDDAAITTIEQIKDNIVLIKFKILEAEYFENKNITRTSFREKFTHFFTELFIQHSYRAFNFKD